MKFYICDNCGNKTPTAQVILKGITGTSGGILLPEQLHKKHFCKPECFWEWVATYKEKQKGDETLDLSGLGTPEHPVEGIDYRNGRPCGLTII